MINTMALTSKFGHDEGFGHTRYYWKVRNRKRFHLILPWYVKPRVPHTGVLNGMLCKFEYLALFMDNQIGEFGH